MKRFHSVYHMCPKTAHFPNRFLAISFASICIWNSRLMPACNLIIWSCSDLDALGKTPMTPSCAFHSLGVRISAKGVNLSLPYLSTPKIGDISILNAVITID